MYHSRSQARVDSSTDSDVRGERSARPGGYTVPWREVIRTKVIQLQERVSDANNTFDESAELIRKGVELNRQAALKKAALNREFDELLAILSGDDDDKYR